VVLRTTSFSSSTTPFRRRYQSLPSRLHPLKYKSLAFTHLFHPENEHNLSINMKFSSSLFIAISALCFSTAFTAPIGLGVEAQTTEPNGCLQKRDGMPLYRRGGGCSRIVDNAVEEADAIEEADTVEDSDAVEDADPVEDADAVEATSSSSKNRGNSPRPFASTRSFASSQPEPCLLKRAWRNNWRR
jgi:hypothetical protein